MKRKAQQGMQTSTAPQTLQNLKTQLQQLQNLNLPNQLQSLTNTVEQLETQVQQLEQMRAQVQKQQQQIQQSMQGQSADDGTQDDIQSRVMEPSKPQSLPMPSSYEPSKIPTEKELKQWFESRTFKPSGPAIKNDDGAVDWKLMLGKTWKEIQDLFGDTNRYDDFDVPNAVSGVRGESRYELTAGKKKKEEHLSPRDSEHNEELPDFWRNNYDYGESPYMNLEKLEKITDKPPFSKRVKKKK